MRDIRFRAWDSLQKYMWHGDFWVDSDSGVFYTYAEIKYDTPNTEIQKRGNMILQQFTGLKDKNGKEIYEGDVLNLDGTKEYHSKKYKGTFVIEADLENWGWCFHWKSIKGYECSTHIMGNTHGDKSDNVEVIGNIYENPELIKT